MLVKAKYALPSLRKRLIGIKMNWGNNKTLVTIFTSWLIIIQLKFYRFTCNAPVRCMLAEFVHWLMYVWRQYMEELLECSSVFMWLGTMSGVCNCGSSMPYTTSHVTCKAKSVLLQMYIWCCFPPLLHKSAAFGRTIENCRETQHAEWKYPNFGTH